MVADRRIPLPYGLGDNIPRNRLWIYNLSLSYGFALFYANNKISLATTLVDQLSVAGGYSPAGLNNAHPI
ncbi:hypothetical protein ANCCEY_14855 [Ancylostoma ceylanicum]|uniref:Uncharacterized protein n=1 Tax=Ancylostoma ceylanicum TaxID=53326 RepID=A0A0D6LEG4_9BILA|nr:hypothetical protein ANCCEY_14855 [Ancylostoma ceylanicum]